MRFLRSLAVMVSLGSTTGCGGVTVHEVSPARPYSLPAITVERIQQCTAEFGKQLEGGQYNVHPVVTVDQDGLNRRVEMEGIPDTAHELSACMSIALGDMAIPETLLQEGAERLKVQRTEANAAQRSLVGHPVVIVVAGVTIVLSEVALEAGAVTILFAVSVELIDKASKDVAELAKRGFKKCVSHYTACMATGLSNPFGGNHWTASHCNGCFERCQTDGVWPGAVGGKTCTYW